MKPRTAPPRQGNVAVAGALLLAAVLMAYWPALRGGFIWDDDAYVTNNPLLTAADGWQRIWFSAHHQSQFFPLVYSTLRLEYALWGLNPLGYHLVNVLLHLANASLVWVILRKLAVPGAWIGAALFALHPVQVETAAWITELKNTQSTFFCLLAVLMWLRFLAPELARRKRFYWLALGFYVLALLSKTTACTLPAALLLAPWMRGERIDRRRLLQIVPFLVLGLAAGLVSIWYEAHLGNYRDEVGQSLTFWERTLVASWALWFYAGKLAWPANLVFSYPQWQVDAGNPVNFLPLAGCLAAAFVLWRWRHKVGRRVIAGVVFFVATLSPLLGFIPLYTFKYTYVADHYQYMACIGLLALAAAGLNRLPRVVPFAGLAVLGVLTWRQAHIYADQTTLWQDTLAKNPASWLAHNNLGVLLRDSGQADEAIRQYRCAIQLRPDYAPAYYNLGIVLFKKGQTGEALVHFQDAIRLGPRDSRAFYNYANALDQTGRTEEAIKQYEEAIRLDPDYVGARINLGLVFSRQGGIDEALAQFHEAVRLDPENVEAHNNLGAVLRAKGRLPEAEMQFRAALRLQPDHGLARANLGAVLLTEGRIDQAILQLQEAIRLNPGDADARTNLARAIARKDASRTR